MEIFNILTDEDGYIISYSVDEQHKILLPEDIYEPCKMNAYKYINEEFIFDENKYNELVALMEKGKYNEKIKKEIQVLKEVLNETDYKVIKCYEAQMAGETLPYDILEIHRERNEIRDKINELEKQLK